MTQMADTPTSDLWIGFRTTNGGSYFWTDGRPRQYVNLGFQVSGHNVNNFLYNNCEWVVGSTPDNLCVCVYIKMWHFVSPMSVSPF